MSKGVDDLVHLGLIVRLTGNDAGGPTDRRQRLIRLTDQGRALLAEFVEIEREL